MTLNRGFQQVKHDRQNNTRDQQNRESRVYPLLRRSVPCEHHFLYYHRGQAAKGSENANGRENKSGRGRLRSDGKKHLEELPLDKCGIIVFSATTDVALVGRHIRSALRIEECSHGRETVESVER